MMPATNFVERWQVYVQHVGNITPGQLVHDLPKTVDLEAPFALRGISLRVARTPGPPSVDYSDVNSLNVQWKDSNNMYTASDLLPVPVALQVGAAAAGGIGGCAGIVYPEVIYPPGATINIDLQNTSATKTLDTTVYFHGVKIFPQGGIDTPTYPARCAMLDYRRQFTALALQPTEERRNQILKVAPDADYVFRAAQCGAIPSFAYGGRAEEFQNLLVKLSDHNVKPFMDDYVDVNYLWGTGDGSGTSGSVYTGNANPGLMVPEIYVRANDLLYLDFQRNDGAFNVVGVLPSATNCDVQIVFQGSKVYLK